MVTLLLSPLTHSLSLKAQHPPYHLHHQSSRRLLCNITSQQQQLKLKQHQQFQFQPFSSSFLGFNPLRAAVGAGGLMKKKKRESGIVCFTAPFSVRELQWVSTICTAVLMLAKGTAINKSFLVPFFVLQAPPSIISWITGEYGMWTAFLALLARIFFFIPGELELPFMAFLLVIVAPYQVMNLRGRQEGVVLSLALAAYLAFEHFIRVGGLQKALDRGSVIATVALICCVAVPCFLLI